MTLPINMPNGITIIIIPVARPRRHSTPLFTIRSNRAETFIEIMCIIIIYSVGRGGFRHHNTVITYGGVLIIFYMQNQIHKNARFIGIGAPTQIANYFKRGFVNMNKCWIDFRSWSWSFFLVHNSIII